MIYRICRGVCSARKNIASERKKRGPGSCGAVSRQRNLKKESDKDKEKRKG